MDEKNKYKSNTTYVTPEKASRILKVTPKTLRIWSAEGKINF